MKSRVQISTGTKDPSSWEDFCNNQEDVIFQS